MLECPLEAKKALETLSGSVRVVVGPAVGAAVGTVGLDVDNDGACGDEIGTAVDDYC